MPRSIQDILDHADQLAERFENFDPGDAVEIPVEEHLLQRAVYRPCSQRATTPRRRCEGAASWGCSWKKIGNLLGTSAQAAQQRYRAALGATWKSVVKPR